VTALAAFGAAASPGLAVKADHHPTTHMQVLTPAPMPPTNAWAAADAVIAEGFSFGVAVANHQQQELLEAISQLAAEQAAQAEGASALSSAPVYYSSDPGEFLACTRARESGSNYSVVSSNGLWRGGYQFTVETWNNTAAHSGRTDLVGVLPEQASPADQDAMAQDLYAWQGRSPWEGGSSPC
jgi:hypothetical protein